MVFVCRRPCPVKFGRLFNRGQRQTNPPRRTLRTLVSAVNPIILDGQEVISVDLKSALQRQGFIEQGRS